MHIRNIELQNSQLLQRVPPSPPPHPNTATKVHLRRDVYDFFKQENGPQRDLFLQAFAFIQNLPAEDYRSYYQIAGIHGLPYEPYRGSTNTKWPWTTANLSWGGYCHHGSVLFPPWHRAHMLLIESVLQKVAISIAKDFKPSLQKTYLAAAQSMRFPYWDWSHRSVPMKGMPTIFTLKTVVVATAPNGSKKSIPNPLRSFAVPKAVGRTQVSSNMFNRTSTNRRKAATWKKNTMLRCGSNETIMRALRR
jgi:hypothetical protein